MQEADRDAWDDLVAACEARGLSPWLRGLVRDDGWMSIGVDATNNEEVGFVGPSDIGGPVNWSWPQHLKDANCVPDPDDAATLGVLLGRAREVWGDPHVEVDPPILDRITGRFVVEAWVVEAWDGQKHVSFHGPTEFSAICRTIVAGLEARHDHR